MKPIVLVTDFGERDYYAGVVKGVIRKISPESPVIDLCHGVPSFYVPAASFILEKSQAYFPSGSIFIAVVDPGVGSERRLLLSAAENAISSSARITGSSRPSSRGRTTWFGRSILPTTS